MPQYPRFEYSAPAYRSRYGDTIGQLLGLQGQRRAQEAIDAGQRSSNLWGGVNESIQNALGGYVNARDQQQQQARAQQRAAEDAEVRGFQLEGLREQRTTTANARARDDRYAQTVNQPKATRATILDGLKDDPELFDRASQTFSKIDQQHNRWLGEYAAGVRTLGENPESALLALADLEEQGYDPKKLAPFRQAITERPESVPDILDKILGASPDERHRALVRPPPKAPTLQGFGPEQDVYANGALVRRGQAKEPTAPASIEAALLRAQQAGDQTAVTELLRLRQRSADAGRDPRAPLGPQSPVAVIGPDGRPVYVRPSEAFGKAPASSREQGRPVTSGDASRIAELDTSLDDLDVLTRTVTGLGATGAAQRVGAALPNAITEFTGWGSDAKQKQAAIDRVKQVIGKALEGGVLRKEDEIKYAKILPTIGDPPAVVTTKLEGLQQAIALRRQRELEAREDAGYDVSRFNQRPNALTGRPPVNAVAPGAGGTASLTLPNGGVINFPNTAALEKFKRENGIR